MRHSALLFLVIAANANAQAVPNETEPVLDATSFIRPALLSGPGFTVDPHVEIRGYMARFTLDTPVGALHAESVEILVDRVAELPALEALESVTQSEAFLRAAGGSIGSTAGGIATVLSKPIDTLAGLPAGVMRYFSNRVRKIGGQAQSASDRVARRFGQDGNPYPRHDGPMGEAHDVTRAESQARASGNRDLPFGSVGKEVGRELKRQIKYGQVKRELARQLGIDPYTTNPYIRERLDELAWAGAGGRFAATSAIAAIGGSGAVVLERGGQLNELVWQLEPEELRERNKLRLQRYCRDELLMRQFVRRGAFTPTLQTALVDALDRLAPAAGGDALLELGMTAKSELEARFIVNALTMVAEELGPRAGAGSLRPIGAGLAYETRDGELVLPMPVDFLAWTDDVASFVDRAEFREARKLILISGTTSVRTERELTARGWSIGMRTPISLDHALAAASQQASTLARPDD